MPDTNNLKRGVVGVVVNDDRLLVIERSQFVKAPGAYCFPGGGIEAGETPPVALAREFQEELNVELIRSKFLWKNVAGWKVGLDWFLVELPTNAEIIANPDEVASFQFLPRDEIRKLPNLLSSNVEFLNALDAGEFTLEW